MVLQRWSPFDEMRQMRRMMNRMWRSMDVGTEDETDIEAWMAPMDVVQDDDTLKVRVSLPGVKRDDLDVMIDENVLTIKGEVKSEREREGVNYLMRERRAGIFQRSLRLPPSVDTDKAESTYDNGVLEITFPRVESRRAKRLEIKAGEQMEQPV